MLKCSSSATSSSRVMRVWHCGQRRGRRRRHLRKPTREAIPKGVRPSTWSHSGQPPDASSYDSVEGEASASGSFLAAAISAVDTVEQTLVELIRPEARDHVLIEDGADLAVRQRALEAVSDFDPHAPIAGRPQQQQPVVAVLLADPPHLKQLDGGLLDGDPVERTNDDDGDLAGGLAFECRGAFVEQRDSLRVEGGRGIGDPGAVLYARIGDAAERLGATRVRREQQRQAHR